MSTTTTERGNEIPIYDFLISFPVFDCGSHRLTHSFFLLFFVQFLFLPLLMKNASSNVENCMTFFFRSQLSLRLKMLSINRYMAQKKSSVWQRERNMVTINVILLIKYDTSEKQDIQ
jgi:hypothetical protein